MARSKPTASKPKTIAVKSAKPGASTRTKGVRAGAKEPRRRVARGTREQRIVAAAIEFFAEEGFRASTRDLASRLGVTQALLYRYFKSKQAPDRSRVRRTVRR